MQHARLDTTGPRLDDLAAMNLGQLDHLYRQAPEPVSLDALDGRPVGRMLAVRYTSLLASPLRRFAASAAFPWGGKTFATVRGASTGRGINRVKLAGTHALFGFTTDIRASEIDGRDCVVLDYEQDQNPGLIQRIHDEIREVASNLWLGPAMWKSDDKPPVLVLWFALDFALPDERATFALAGT